MTAGAPTHHVGDKIAAEQQADRIARLFAEGHGIDFVCERGHYGGANGWTRARVIEVVSQRGWTLDGSGRVPRQDRPAVTPGKPVPDAPSGKTQIGVPVTRPPVVPPPRPSTGRAQVAAMLDRHPETEIGAFAAAAASALAGQFDQAVAEATTTKTPTEKGPAPAPPAPAGTAPESAPVTGRRAPDAAPQVSPPRTRTGKDGERGASDALAAPPVTPPLPPLVVVELDLAAADLAQQLAAARPTVDAQPVELLPAGQLLEHAATHDDERIRHLADRARLLVADLRTALAVDAERARLRARLAVLDAERDVILAKLAEHAATTQAPVADVEATPRRRRTDHLTPASPAVTDRGGLIAVDKHGTWGGFLAHRYAGQTAEHIEATCPPCHEAKAGRGRKATA